MRIAVAHPDRLVREAIRRSLGQGDLKLIWSVADGIELERMRRREPPDLLLLDASLVGQRGLGMNGASVNGQSNACLVLAADDRCAGVFEALSAGALGHLVPPQLEADGELTGAARLLTRIQRLQSLIRPAPAEPAAITGSQRGTLSIIALGASTGGPQALARVLAGLPAGLPAAVLIVQHIDGEYSDGLVEWLGSHSLLPVQLAQRGDSLQSGRVYVGSTQGHLVLLPSEQVSYTAALRSDLHVPSVDALFNSLADHARPGAAALLTGMGHDGARGLLRLRQAGWHTIAQDETSCAVYGMPRAAVECGAVVQSLPVSTIGASLARQLTGVRPSLLR